MDLDTKPLKISFVVTTSLSWTILFAYLHNLHNSIIESCFPRRSACMKTHVTLHHRVSISRHRGCLPATETSSSTRLPRGWRKWKRNKIEGCAAVSSGIAAPRVNLEHIVFRCSREFLREQSSRKSGLGLIHLATLSLFSRNTRDSRLNRASISST